MADIASAGATAWRRLGPLSGERRSPDTADALLRKDLRRALVAFALAVVLIAAWHPWTALTAAPNAATSCALSVAGGSGTLTVAASGQGASEWCGGEITRAAGAAAAATADIPKPVCDFFVGTAHVTVAALNAADATAFCASLGTVPGGP